MKQFSLIISWLCVGFFIVCLVSGALIAFEYYPHLAYKSVMHISYEVSYGMFFRKMHYFSGEATLVLSLFHTFFELYKRSDITPKRYYIGVFALFLLIVLMFSGYVLKADLNAISAAQVALGLMENVSFLQPFVYFIKDTDQFFYRFYLIHIVIIPAIFIYALYIHTKTLQTKLTVVAFGLCLILMIIDMPQDIDPSQISNAVSGPWFFLGAENLLIKNVNQTVVVLYMVAFFAIFSILYKRFKFGLFLMLLWIISYAYFTFA